MRGYILNLFKYATFPSGIKSHMRNYLDDISRKNLNPASQTLLVYGDYDRISIKEVQDFSRFRDVDRHAQDWLGSRHTILLYELPDRAYGGTPGSADDFLRNFCTADGDAPPEELEESEELCEYRNFLVFTMVTVNPVLHNKGFGSMLNSCCKLIDRRIRENNVRLIEPDAISYQVYGSFSSSELALVWWVNQYEDAFRLMEALRHSAFTYDGGSGQMQSLLPFVSLYSITAQPKAGTKNIPNRQEIQGKAELKFVFQDGVMDDADRKKFFERELMEKLPAGFGNGGETGKNSKNWKACGAFYSVGEYDYSISLPAGFLCDPQTRIFYRDRPLHWASPGMHEFVSSSCVQLYYDMQFKTGSRLKAEPMNCPELGVGPRQQKMDLIDKIKQIKRMIYGPQENSEQTSQDGPGTVDLFLDYRNRGLRSIIKAKIPETDGLCDSLDLLYTDFVNNCSNLTSTAWAVDLVTQFIAIIDYIANEFDSNYDSTRPADNLFSHIKSICEIYIQMIYHIAQSRRTVFVVPSCHLRYMGQYDLILHAYYGWEKYLLDLAYSLPRRNGVQPILIPILTIDVLPEICTQIYKIPKHYKPEERISNIFSINMPLGAMTDFLRYALTMCHETAHLIIPRDRDRRNQVFGMLFFSELTAYLFTSQIFAKNLLDSGPSDGSCEHLLPSIKKGFMTVIYNKMRPFFMEKFHTRIMDACRDIPDNCPPWNEYLTMLMAGFSDLVDNENDLILIIEELSEYRAFFAAVITDIVDNFAMQRSWDASIVMPEESHGSMKETWLESLNLSLSTQKHDAIEALKTLLLIYSGDIYNESYVLSEAYREACQDLFMIRVFQLDLVDYLVFIDRHRNDTVTLQKRPPKAEMLRIAMICDYILSRKNQKNQTNQINQPDDSANGMLTSAAVIVTRFDDLCDDYIELLVRVPEMRTTDTEKRQNLEDMAEKCFGNIRTWLNNYFINYTAFRPLLLEQLKSADPYSCSPETKNRLMNNKMHGFYLKWKEAVMLDNDDEMHRRIFANNIEMIQQYQMQETFENLALKLTGSDGNHGAK